MNYILYGEEAATMKKKIHSIVKDLHLNMEQVSIYDAQQVPLKVILEDVSSIPFFEENKVVLVQNATFLSSKDTTGYDLAPLLSYLKDPMDFSTLILTCACTKLDQRKKIVKEIIQCSKVFECSRMNERDKEDVIRTLVKRRKLSIKTDALQLFIDRMPLDLAIIENEFDKLSLFEKEIDVNTIHELTIRALEENVFDIAEAMLKKDMKKTFRLWKDLEAQQIEPIYLIATLASQFRFLYQVKLLMNQGFTKKGIVSETQAHPYRVQKAMEQCQWIGIDSLLTELQELADLDQKIKGGQIDKKLGFELYLLKNGIKKQR